MRRLELLGGAAIAAVAAALVLLGNVVVAEASTSPSAFVQNVIYSNKIAIFSKSYCPYVTFYLCCLFVLAFVINLRSWGWGLNWEFRKRSNWNLRITSWSI